MNRNILIVSIIGFVFLMLLVSPLNPFLTGFVVQDAQQAPSNAYQNGNARFFLPSTAVKINPGLYRLGETTVDGQIVEGFAFIDYRGNVGKPTGCEDDGKCKGWEDASCADCQGNGGGDDPKTDRCYSFLSKGSIWKTVEPYVVNPANTEGLSDIFVTSNIAGSPTFKFEAFSNVYLMSLSS